MIDNNEMEKVMELLENLEDQGLAVTLLREFNDKSRKLGLLLMNQDSDLSNTEWKEKCNNAKEEMDEFLKKIEDLT